MGSASIMPCRRWPEPAAARSSLAHLAEGLRARGALRKEGLADEAVRIYLLHGLQPGARLHPTMLSHRLGPVLGSEPEIEAWARHSAEARPPAAIQVDTGMNRIGLAADRAARMLGEAFRATGADLLMSHFVAAEEPDNPINGRQIASFDRLRASAPAGAATSLANSSGVFLSQKPHYDLVRPGFALYGGNPCPGRPNPMRPVVGLRAAVLQTRVIQAGDTVGYNGRWTARRQTTLATIGVGYADGLLRNAETLGSPGGPCTFVDGVACPLVGRLSMDLSVVDVTDAPPAAIEPGAPLDLIGGPVDVDAFARSCGTVGYEVLTSLGRRYRRDYVEGTG